ncbi:SUKH-4 family immunity protein [Streptomyces sp. SS1-1]|uniref:SUKH-4 family immunity protein n=1 Tax=Streptomyces sp. SS1-1 TaxID=2651869 RepID=UPI00178C5672|nr:SUKH-4 family immunity protein [Streptomyces sp. SS1-1]
MWSTKYIEMRKAGVTPDRALEQAENWLATPHRLHPALAIRGPAGAGKTGLLRALAERLPNAVYVDCQGLHAADIARHLLEAWGIAHKRLSLPDAARSIQQDGIALLANVHWADSLVTSNEPSRITQDMVGHFRRSARPTIRFVIEREADQPWVLLPSDNELVLQPPADAQADGEELHRLLNAHPALWALAASELRVTPLAALTDLCSILGIESSAAHGLVGAAERLPNLLVTSADETGEITVAFHAESLRHRIRQLRPVDHGTIVTALTPSLRRRATDVVNVPGAVQHYAARTLGVHVVQAGRLDEVLSDGSALAHLTPTGLLRALAVRWPGGIPQGGIAMDVHYLEELGLASVPHEEWASWLHHCALSRGEERLAEDIVREVGNRMPWRTTWSNCRPFGMFGRFGKSNVGALGHPSTGGTEERVRAALTEGSREAAGPESRPPVRHIFDRGRDDISLFEFQRLPCGDWLLDGASGLFVIEAGLDTQQRPRPSPLAEPFIEEPITQAAVWECPAPALAPDAPSREWLEATFGHGTCRTLREDELPTGLVHADSRRFLTRTGLPFRPHHLPFMSTIDAAATGLVTTPWSGYTTSPEAPGPFFHLGQWTGGDVFLDGRAGAVVQDGSTGYDEVVVAGSLRTFLILLRLCHEFLVSDFATNNEREDALEGLQEWAKTIDPATEESPIWEEALDTDLCG